MFGDGLAYRGILGFFVLMALGATVFAGFGLHTILTGGTTDGQVETDELGAFACETFDGDPEVGHDREVDLTVLGDSRIDSVNSTATEAGDRIEIAVDGDILDTSARHADGTEVAVEREAGLVVIEQESAEPFRLWIDSVDEDATVVRSQLDICPPA